MEVVEMTTATVTRQREILEERWHSAVTKPKVFQEPDGARSTGLDNCEDFYRWEEAVIRIATRIRGDGLDGDELEKVEGIAAEIWSDHLRDRLLEWAGERAS